MTRAAWRRFGAAIRERDLTGILILVSQPLRVVRFDRMLILEASLIAERPLLKKARDRAPGLLTRMATDTDLPELSRRFPHAAAKYAQRLQGGDECFLVESGVSAIAMSWVSFNRHRSSELGCRIEIPAEACWGHDTFILPEHRMQGAFPVLMNAMLTTLKQRGLTKLYASISHLSTGSRAAHSRIGYTTVAVIDRFVVTGTPYYRITLRGGKSSWLRGDAGAPPVLRLDEEGTS